jgi:hypothetical protein
VRRFISTSNILILIIGYSALALLYFEPMSGGWQVLFFLTFWTAVFHVITADRAR